jgi:hypothetical protein
MLTASTRAWLRTRAEESLAEPQREALLSDPQRSVQQQRARQGIATNGVVEPRTKWRVAMKGEEGHGWKL